MYRKENNVMKVKVKKLSQADKRKRENAAFMAFEPSYCKRSSMELSSEAPRATNEAELWNCLIIQNRAPVVPLIRFLLNEL